MVGDALVLFFFAMGSWFGLQVVRILEGDTLVSLPWVPVQVTQSVIPIGAALFIIAELTTLPERLREAASVAAAYDPEHLEPGAPTTLEPAPHPTNSGLKAPSK